MRTKLKRFSFLLSAFALLASLWSAPARADGTDTLTVDDSFFFSMSATSTAKPEDEGFYEFTNVPVTVFGFQGSYTDGVPQPFEGTTVIPYDVSFNANTAGLPNFVMIPGAGCWEAFCEVLPELNLSPNLPFTIRGNVLTFIPGSYDSGQFIVAAPEPGPLSMLAAGLFSLLGFAIRKRASHESSRQLRLPG